MSPLLTRSTWAAVAAAIVVLLLTSGFAYRDVRQLRADEAWVTHSGDILEALSNVIGRSAEAESGVRGYVMSGQDGFLGQYRIAADALAPAAARVRDLTVDNAPQRARVAILATRVNDELAFLTRTIALRGTDPAAATAAMSSGQGQIRADAIQRAVGDMQAAERVLLAEREGRTAAAYRTVIVSIVVTALIGIIVLCVIVAIIAYHVRQRERSNAVIFRHEEQLRTTLASIGDAVIATDEHARVTLLNPVAESLTRWPSADAVGRPLTEIFDIVNETTRQAAANPAFRAIQEGAIVGLANHTVLVARDRSERPIDDSAAPIRDGSGKVTGAVLVFRDITERRAADRALDGHLHVLSLRSRIASALTASGTLAAMLQDAAQAFVDELGASAARIWASDALGGTSRIQASAGADPDTAADDLVARIARERRPVLEGAAAGEGSGARPAGASSTFAGYPLAIGDRVVGVLTLRSSDPFSDTASQSLASVADELALGIARRHDAEEIQRLLARESDRSRRLRQVADAAVTLNTASSRSSVVDVVSAETTRILGGRASVVNTLADVPALSRHRPLVDRAGRFIGHLCVEYDDGRAFDETDDALLEQLAHMGAIAVENTTLYEELREDDRRKDEFLATLSHELRNPLAPIVTAVQLMEMAGGLPAPFDESRQVIKRQLVHLVRLVDDLLDLSRISLDKLELQLAPTNLAGVIRTAIEAARPAIDQCQHTFTVERLDEDVLVNADVTRLAQVFGNLLSNAAKYTPNRGHIWLNARTEGETVVVSVRDNGIGIPAELLPKVFDLFLQGATPSKRIGGGLGIGLTLVRRLVDMHGGSVDVRSAGANAGSEFVVTLPVARAVAEAAVSNPAVVALERPVRRVLVVDDNHDTADGLAQMLTILGHDVTTVYDGGAAVECAASFRPHVAFLDLGLPVLSGNDAARRIRVLPGGDRIILVAVTGWGQESDRRRSREAGFDHHVVKPMTFDHLAKLLQTLPES